MNETSGIGYFAAIEKREYELSQIGASYLKGLPFISNNDVRQRLYEIAHRTEASEEENPEWVEMTLDGHIPFSSIPSNGSLYYAFGFSCVANDARLRNLLELAEGRTTVELELEVLAEKEIVDSYVTAKFKKR